VSSQHTPPIVLCFSGLDPTGGAGIQADIQAISQHGCHPAPIITANTIQDTHNVSSFQPMDEQFILKQAHTILQDMPVSAIKIGMLGSGQVAEAIYGRDTKVLPTTVIYDPVLTSTLPAHIAAPSGMNAIAHCVEAMYSETANPIISMMAEEGVRALARALPIVVREPDNMEARTEPLHGA